MLPGAIHDAPPPLTLPVHPPPARDSPVVQELHDDASAALTIPSRPSGPGAIAFVSASNSNHPAKHQPSLESGKHKNSFKELLRLLEREHEDLVESLHDQISVLRNTRVSISSSIPLTERLSHPLDERFSQQSIKSVYSNRGNGGALLKLRQAETLEDIEAGEKLHMVPEMIDIVPSAHNMSGGSNVRFADDAGEDAAALSVQLPTTICSTPSLPGNKFQLSEVWAKKFKDYQRDAKSKIPKRLMGATTVKNLKLHHGDDGEVDFSASASVHAKRRRREWRDFNIIQWPNSPKRLCWDMIGMSLIVWDLIQVPLQTFDLPDHIFLTVMGWIARLFWTADIPASFVVGYISHGVTVMSPRKIAINYMKSWFCLDFSLVLFDWLFFILKASAGGSDSGNLGRVFRVLRGMRVARLLRLLKVRQILASVQEIINSRYTFIMMGITKLILILLAMNHVVACIWYGIGRYTKDQDQDQGSKNKNWIDDVFEPADTILYRYSTSLHWSLTQFTPASMSVQPVNGPERVFSNVILILGLVLFSSFTANLTNSMSQMRNMNKDLVEQFWLLRRFMFERSVSRELSARIQRFCEHQSTLSKSLVQEKEVKILALLSSQLRDELHFAIYANDLVKHKVIDAIRVLSDATLYRLSSVFKRTAAAQDDSLFFSGEEGKQMYFVHAGELAYVRKRHDCSVATGQWMCEAVLWTKWVHLGDMHAITNTDLLSVTATGFAEATLANPAVAQIIARYANEFVEHLSNSHQYELSDIHDEFESDALKDVPNLPPEKDTISISALRKVSLYVRASVVSHVSAARRASVAAGKAVRISRAVGNQRENDA